MLFIECSLEATCIISRIPSHCAAAISSSARIPSMVPRTAYTSIGVCLVPGAAASATATQIVQVWERDPFGGRHLHRTLTQFTSGPGPSGRDVWCGTCFVDPEPPKKRGAGSQAPSDPPASVPLVPLAPCPSHRTGGPLPLAACFDRPVVWPPARLALRPHSLFCLCLYSTASLSPPSPPLAGP